MLFSCLPPSCNILVHKTKASLLEWSGQPEKLKVPESPTHHELPSWPDLLASQAVAPEREIQIILSYLDLCWWWCYIKINPN